MAMGEWTSAFGRCDNLWRWGNGHLPSADVIIYGDGGNGHLPSADVIIYGDGGNGHLPAADVIFYGEGGII